MESLKKDALWITIITIAVVSMVIGSILISEKLEYSNDTKVITQFIYEQLSECNEKIAAYGEKNVKLDISKNQIKSEDIIICLEKLGAYGGNISIRTKDEVKSNPR